MLAAEQPVQAEATAGENRQEIVEENSSNPAGKSSPFGKPPTTNGETKPAAENQKQSVETPSVSSLEKPVSAESITKPSLVESSSKQEPEVSEQKAAEEAVKPVVAAVPEKTETPTTKTAGAEKQVETTSEEKAKEPPKVTEKATSSIPKPTTAGKTTPIKKPVTDAAEATPEKTGVESTSTPVTATPPTKESPKSARAKRTPTATPTKVSNQSESPVVSALSERPKRTPTKAVVAPPSTKVAATPPKPKALATTKKETPSKPATPSSVGRKRKAVPEEEEETSKVVAADDSIDSTTSPAIENPTVQKRKSESKSVSRLTMSPRRKVPPAEPRQLKPGTVLLTCGDGGSGQLGHGEAHTSGRKPRRVDVGLPPATADNPITQIAAGDMHSLVLYKDGSVYICGAGDNGTIPPKPDGSRLEDNDKFSLVHLPADLLEQTGLPIAVAAGGGVSCVLTEHGSVIAWGYIHADGEVGQWPVVDEMKKKPTILFNHDELNDQIVQVAVGCTHVAALSKSHRVYTFGDAAQGQLGRAAPNRQHRKRVQLNVGVGSHVSLPISRPVAHPSSVFCTQYGTVVTTDDPNTVFVTGLNNYAQLGVPISDDVNSDENDDKSKWTLNLVKSSNLHADETFTTVVGDHHTVALDADGTVWTIGRNVDNRLGLGNYSSGSGAEQHWRSFELNKVDLPGKAIHVGANNASSTVVLEDGSAYSWGLDTSGQCGIGLGDGDVIDTPTKVLSKHLEGLKIVQVAVGAQHALFLAEKGDDEDMEDDD